MRSARTMKRHSALALVAAIGVAGPILLPLPALAQGDTAAEDSGGYYATPPPIDPGLPPNDTRKPDKNYQPRVACVQRNLEYNEDIQNAPWGQQYLRIDEVHNLMRAETGHVGISVKDKKPVRVAVIDTGVTPHPYFGNRLKSGGDYVRPNGDGLHDCDGHGTQVAGIIAAARRTTSVSPESHPTPKSCQSDNPARTTLLTKRAPAPQEAAAVIPTRRVEPVTVAMEPTVVSPCVAPTPPRTAAHRAAKAPAL